MQKKCTIEYAVMSHFFDKSNSIIFFVRTFLFWENNHLFRINASIQINAPLKVQILINAQVVYLEKYGIP